MAINQNSLYQGQSELDIMHYASKYNNSIYKFIVSGESIDNQIILDFGAGKGEFCNRFENNIFAVEIDSTMHKFINCTVEDNICNFNKEFTTIYSSNVLEHISNDMGAIRDFYDNLSTGGVVKILVPARMEIYSNMDKNVGHYRRYDKKDLVSKFTSAGFEVSYCRYFDFLGYFAAFIYKLAAGFGDISITSLKIYDTYIFPISRAIDSLTFGKIIGKNLVLRAVKK